MKGLYINNAADGHDDLGLLARRPGIEIMSQTLKPGATAWIVPAGEVETFEFFYLLKGRVCLQLKEGHRELLQGDSFYVEWLDDGFQIKVIENTELLYISNKPLFDKLQNYQQNLHTLLMQINEKDHSTFRHSHNVMRYSVLIAQKLKRTQNDIDDLINASLFHDIGKCFVPNKILKKPAKLTTEEFFIMQKHPLDSARLLEPVFGKRVASIAASHHERLDGSGYPLGLKRSDISLNGRIISVADSFDAMTTKRVYMNNAKTMQQAINELCKMSDKYDEIVCAALRDLVESGELHIESDLPEDTTP